MIHPLYAAATIYESIPPIFSVKLFFIPLGIPSSSHDRFCVCLFQFVFFPECVHYGFFNNTGNLARFCFKKGLCTSLKTKRETHLK